MSINNKVSTYMGCPIVEVTTMPAKPVTGMLFFDTRINQYYVYDGSHWVELTTTSAILNIPKTVRVTDLCEQHPGLKELKQELDEAQEKFDAYLALVKE